MDTTIALVIVVIAVIGLVIYQEVAKNKTQFENNEAHREILQIFLDGFRAGLETENTNNRVYVDDILRRVGFTAPEMTTDQRITEVVEERLQTEDEIPPVVLDHETEFDIEEARKRDGDTAQWVDEKLLNDLPMNTQEPSDQESPHT